MGGNSNSRAIGGTVAVDTVTVAFAVFVVSAALVPVIVTVVFVVTLGAVKLPVEEIVPLDAVHVTEVFVVFNTVARNCCVPADGIVTFPGDTDMLTGGWSNVTEKLPFPYFPEESVTYTENANWPVLSHVPVMAPVEVLMAKPLGRFAALYVYGAVPPLALMLAEYDSVATPVGMVPVTVRVVLAEGGAGLPNISCGRIAEKANTRRNGETRRTLQRRTLQQSALLPPGAMAG